MGHQLNRVVAGIVTVPIVNRLQMIEVEREQRERLAVATRSLDLAGETLRKAAIVGKAGHWIGERICTKAGFAGVRRDDAGVASDELVGIERFGHVVGS